MFDLSTIAISLVYTIILYGTGPFLFAKLRKRPIKTGSVKAFSVVYTVIMWLGSNALMVLYADGTVSSGWPAVLWGMIFYRMLKKNLIKASRLIDDNQPGSSSSPKAPAEVLSEHDCSGEESAQPDNIVSEPENENPHTEVVLIQTEPKDPPPGNLQTCSLEATPIKRRFSVLAAVLALTCVLLAASSCFFWSQSNSSRKDVEALEEENADLHNTMVDRENATVKRFYRTETTVTLMPQSTNPDHRPQVYDLSRTKIQVLGKVIKAEIAIK